MQQPLKWSRNITATWASSDYLVSLRIAHVCCIIMSFLKTFICGQAVLAGIILDWTVVGKGYPDYSITFYLADGMFVFVILLMSLTSISKLVRLIDVDIFMIMMLLLGTCWGFLESFLFVYLTELKASSYLLGNIKRFLT